MALHKNFRVLRSKTKELLEEFATLESAEKFMILMQSKGEQVVIETLKEDEIENKGFEIEGLEIDEPSVDFGSELDDMFGTDEPNFNLDGSDSDPVEFD